MQMENPSASSRGESFPIGLRVLVVDDDLTWLKILEKMLRKCSYEVTTCCKARVALDLLRERKDKFDIVISDVNMPDMDGFKLLEHVGLEMDLPVIMMSVDGETSRVMKGVQHGACDYLLKPIRMKELRNIWQHVYRKRVHEVKDMETHDINDDIHFLSGFEQFDDRLFMSTIEMASSRKRKDVETREFNDQELNDPTMKKARVVWSIDLHQKFVNAVDQIGFDKVGPKKILDLMNVPGLTRENIASHLQKYRMYLGRLQKQNEARALAANMQSHSTEYHSRSLTSQNPVTFKQNIEVNSYGHNSPKFQEQIKIQDVQENEFNSQNLSPVNNIKKGVKSNPHSQKANNGPQPGPVLHFKGMFAGNDKISKQERWHEGIPLRHFLQYQKHDHEPFSLLEDYSHPATTQETEPTVWHLQCPPSLVSVSSSSEKEKDETDFDVKQSIAIYEGRHGKTLSNNSVSYQMEHGVVNSKVIGICSKENDSIPFPVDLNTENEADLISFPEDLSLYAVQGFGHLENFAFNGMEMRQHIGCTSISELQSNWYDELEFNCELWYDSSEYPLPDECLFA